MKSSNHYASTVAIPDYVEVAIKQFSRHDLLDFVDALIAAIRDRRWTEDNQNFNINYDTDQWLIRQSVATYKDIHKWVSMELL